VAASNDVRIIMPGQKWDSGVGNNGPHCGLQLVNNANALENQLFKEAKHTLVHELNSRKALGTLGRRRPRAGPEAVVYDVTSNAYGNAWQTPATLSERVKAAALALDPKSTSRATKVQNRPPTNIKGPETNEHGSPVVYYPWATPERDKVPRSHVPISGWKDKTRAPWIVAEGSKEKFQDMIGCPGGFGPRPARVVLKKEKSRPSPFCVERMPKQSRHEMCSSIAQQPAHLDPGCGTATRTLGTQENALSSNLRERGGPAWASYLKGANPILQFRDDHLLSAVPHRSIARLVKRMDSKPDADLLLRRSIHSREKQPRKQRAATSMGTHSASSGWCSIGKSSYSCPSKQDRIDSTNPATIKIRRDDYIHTSEPRMRSPDTKSMPLPEYA